MSRKSKRPTRKGMIHAIRNSFGIKSDVARILKVTRKTAITWINGDEEFTAELEAARAVLARGALGTLVNALREGDLRDRITAAKYILATIGKSLEPEVFGNNNNTITITTEEQARSIFMALDAMNAIDKGITDDDDE